MGIETIKNAVETFLHEGYGVWNSSTEEFDYPFAGTVVDYGRRALTKQINQGDGCANRVVFCPPATRAGVFGPPRSPGQPPGASERGVGAGRPIATMRFPYEVHCWAYDPTAKDNELAQHNAALALARAVLAAIRSSAQGGVGAHALANGGFTTPPVELLFGAEFVFDYVGEIRFEDLPMGTTTSASVQPVVQLLNPVDGETLDQPITVPTPP